MMKQQTNGIDRSLSQYREKRNFENTREPQGNPVKKGSKALQFVIQQHQARRMHYDLRLQIDGTLKSWAVPKGISLNTRDRRLAAHTEDHPLEYLDFEGNIPPGEYGAGSMIVWDQGTFRNLKAEKEQPVSLEESYRQGKLEFWLEGQKIRGGFALIRTKDEKNWILVKMKDDEANTGKDPVKEEPQSVISGKTVNELHDEQD